MPVERRLGPLKLSRELGDANRLSRIGEPLQQLQRQIDRLGCWSVCGTRPLFSLRRYVSPDEMTFHLE
jgi:hypothetical protein